MSYKATHWAWEIGLKMPEKFVLIALADMADEKHSCFPGQATLSQMTGASESTVRRAVRKLEDMGLLVREERRTTGGVSDLGSVSAAGRRCSDRLPVRLRGRH